MRCPGYLPVVLLFLLFARSAPSSVAVKNVSLKDIIEGASASSPLVPRANRFSFQSSLVRRQDSRETMGSCSNGLALCGTTCVDILTNATSCGACDHLCPSIDFGSTFCSSGRCTARCSDAQPAVFCAGTLVCASSGIPSCSGTIDSPIAVTAGAGGGGGPPGGGPGGGPPGVDTTGASYLDIMPNGISTFPNQTDTSFAISSLVYPSLSLACNGTQPCSLVAHASTIPTMFQLDCPLNASCTKGFFQLRRVNSSQCLASGSQGSAIQLTQCRAFNPQAAVDTGSPIFTQLWNFQLDEQGATTTVIMDPPQNCLQPTANTNGEPDFVPNAKIVMGNCGRSAAVWSTGPLNFTAPLLSLSSSIPTGTAGVWSANSSGTNAAQTNQPSPYLVGGAVAGGVCVFGLAIAAVAIYGLKKRRSGKQKTARGMLHHLERPESQEDLVNGTGGSGARHQGSAKSRPRDVHLESNVIVQDSPNDANTNSSFLKQRSPHSSLTDSAVLAPEPARIAGTSNPGNSLSSPRNSSLGNSSSSGSILPATLFRGPDSIASSAFTESNPSMDPHLVVELREMAPSSDSGRFSSSPYTASERRTTKPFDYHSTNVARHKEVELLMKTLPSLALSHAPTAGAMSLNPYSSSHTTSSRLESAALSFLGRPSPSDLRSEFSGTMHSEMNSSVGSGIAGTSRRESQMLSPREDTSQTDQTVWQSGPTTPNYSPVRGGHDDMEVQSQFAGAPSILQNINPFYLSLGGRPLSNAPVEVNRVLVASADFTPTLTDELELVQGSAYYIDLLWADGWFYGRNLSTGSAGYAPAVALQAAAASFVQERGDLPRFSLPIPDRDLTERSTTQPPLSPRTALTEGLSVPVPVPPSDMPPPVGDMPPPSSPVSPVIIGGGTSLLPSEIPERGPSKLPRYGAASILSHTRIQTSPSGMKDLKSGGVSSTDLQGVSIPKDTLDQLLVGRHITREAYVLLRAVKERSGSFSDRSGSFS
ncbi:hypothetical protein M427DRAFT_71854 [Gonapodya prolifera JEL478]|uniref:SH3 domain-containing protein n=1 Tax=Gonapodya prolifera (strain JEL478) TaxID=1344416 RepID=A0A139A7T3_GONPJ|nr:hypothetical protein M427DRAFT_71854 [Gonapodya prolifera JEL478]|eukprot:KXS12738.1 hypothetical protein M427DRAFT_71854 [Gonapodya prolifera JEL478]